MGETCSGIGAGTLALPSEHVRRAHKAQIHKLHQRAAFVSVVAFGLEEQRVKVRATLPCRIIDELVNS